MREVGAEEHALGAERVDQVAHVVLVERVDPHVASEGVARVLVEAPWHLLVHAVEAVEQAGHPGAAVLDHADAQIREAREETVRDERGERVEDVAALFVEERAEQRLVEALELVAAALPVGRVAVVPGVGVVHHHGGAGVLAQLPERIELGERGGERGAVGLGHRRGTDEHGLGAVVEAPLELGHRAADVRQGDNGRRDDPALVVERPVLEQPLVVRVHDGVRELEVGFHVLLEHPRGRGEQHAAVDSLLVHQLQAEVRPAECLRAPDRLGQLAQALAFGVVAPEVLGPGARCRDHDVGRVGDGLGDLAEDLELVAPVHLDEPDRAVVLLREVARVRVHRLVHVVVGVPDLVAELAGHPVPPVCDRPLVTVDCHKR